MILTKNNSWASLILGAFLSFTPSSHASIEIPFLSGPVIDEAGFLSAQEKSNLASQIFAQKTHAQIQIWTLPSLQGENIESLSIKAAETWKLGTAQKDNGVLIIASRQDRRIRIEVGRGLEGDIPDIIANRIIQSLIIPNFRSGNYYQGFSSAISAVVGYAGGEVNPATQRALEKSSKRKSKNINALINILFILLFFVFPWFGRIFGFASIFGSRRYGSSWGGGSWGGGGGGWSGGGGSFGGGGSSGSW